MRDAFLGQAAGAALGISCGLAVVTIAVSALVVKRADLLPAEH